MKLAYYLAPLEGITGYTYRNVIRDLFGGQIDKYFTPFFAPHSRHNKDSREVVDVWPENNEGVNLIPQILTDDAKDLLRFEKDMYDMFGYEEVNVNMGCPSATVVSKGRGAGFLENPQKVDEFLYEVFAHNRGRVSVKTRLGLYETDEFYKLMEIFNKYPLCELIIHPRVRNEFYSGTPHQDIFVEALKNAKIPLCYSGDIFCTKDRDKLLEKAGFTAGEYLYSQAHIRKPADPVNPANPVKPADLAGFPHGKIESLEDPAGRSMFTSIMLGRGMLRDPSLIRQLAGGEAMSREEFLIFNEKLTDAFDQLFDRKKHALFKLKELWTYMIVLFPGREEYLRAIRMTSTLSEYRKISGELIGTYF